jgi:LysR family transcriptional regulator, hydrogen peroxide-inducible genes activator
VEANKQETARGRCPGRIAWWDIAETATLSLSSRPPSKPDRAERTPRVPPDMDLPQLRAFLKVAELSSVTRAAEALHQTQPAVSGQIAKLEHELGRSLFERLARGVRLTDAGVLFREKVDPLLRQLDEVKESMAVDPDAGRLTVAAIPTVAPFLLPAVLTTFTAEYPRARVEVMELTTAEIQRHLAIGLIDLAVLALPVAADDALALDPLFDEELLLALPAGHRLTRAKCVTAADLADEPFVLLHDAHCLTGELLGFCTRQRLAPLVTARIHQLATLLELVRLGHGVSFVPKMAAARKDGVQFRSLNDEPPRRTVGAVWAKGRVQPRLAKEFLRHLKGA